MLFSVPREAEPGRVHHLGPYELRFVLGLASGRCQQDLRGQEGSKVMELIPLTSSRLGHFWQWLCPSTATAPASDPSCQLPERLSPSGVVKVSVGTGPWVPQHPPLTLSTRL